MGEEGEMTTRTDKAAPAAEAAEESYEDMAAQAQQAYQPAATGAGGDTEDDSMTYEPDDAGDNTYKHADDEGHTSYDTVAKIAEQLVNNKQVVDPILKALAEYDAIWNRLGQTVADGVQSVTIAAADMQPREDALNEIDALQRWAVERGNQSAVEKLKSWQEAVSKTTPETFDPDEHIRQMELIRGELDEAERSRQGVR